MSGTVTNIKLNLSKLPKDKIFSGKNGKLIDLTIAERQSPDQFGNTHTVYHYDSKTRQKTYCGEGKLFTFGQQEGSAPATPSTGGGGDFDDLPF